MALDARITDVVPYAGGATIVLEDRDSQAGPAGQPRMEILNPTVLPLAGDVIWGGSESAYIVSGGVEYPYRRVGYTKLVQDWEPTNKP